ncbi:MAG TPA: CU044_5270 family protein [Nonomuraea sp.]|nr:CU044_5270 family protein [Nonomuraea sp.]
MALLTPPGTDQQDVAQTERCPLARTRRFQVPALSRKALLSGVLGVAATVTLMAGYVFDPADQTPTVQHVMTSEAAKVLEDAALVAESRPLTPVPGPAQWQYRKSVSSGAGFVGAGGAGSGEHWTRYDGREVAGLDETGNVRITAVSADPGDDDLSPQEYDERLRELPTDPESLLAHIREDSHWIELPAGEKGAAKDDADDRAFRGIFTYLQQQAFMPANLEAAMYRALAKIPGVEIKHDVADAAGRRGIGVYRTPEGGAPDYQQYLIFQPETYRYLGTRVEWLRDSQGETSVKERKQSSFRAGDVYATAELAAGIVNEAGQRP